MFEVNFFEKKQRNFLPTLLVLIFAALAVAIGAYLFISSTRYQYLETKNNAWLAEQQGNLAVSREVERYRGLTRAVETTQASLLDSQYPINKVVDELVALVPNEGQTISTFDITESNHVSFILVDMTVEAIATTMENIKGVPYVASVQMLRLENQQTDNQYLVEFAIHLDEAALNEEVQP